MLIIWVLGVVICLFVLIIAIGDGWSKKAIIISALLFMVFMSLLLIEPLTYDTYHLKEKTFITDEYESKKGDILKFNSPVQITEVYYDTPKYYVLGGANNPFKVVINTKFEMYLK